MRRLLFGLWMTIVVCSASLLASDTKAEATTADIKSETKVDAKDTAAESTLTKEHATKEEQMPPEGFLWRTLFGDKLERKTGIKVDFDWEMGFNKNNTESSGLKGSDGYANLPNLWPIDTGFNLDTADMYIHRDLRSSVLPHIGALPGPMPKNIDWGFRTVLQYGANLQGCLATGWEQHWGVNDTGVTNIGYTMAHKSYFLCQPEAHFEVYLPVWKGVVLEVGRDGGTVGLEFQEPIRQANFFYSYDYTVFIESHQGVGGWVTAALMRNRKYGFLSAQLGITQGEQTVISSSGHAAFNGAVVWHSSNMATTVNYGFQYEDANMLPDRTAYLHPGKIDFCPSIYHVISPRGQLLQRHSLILSHEFRPRLTLMAEGFYGRQSGDGKADTLLVATPVPVPGQFIPNFKGAEYGGVLVEAMYKLTRNTTVGARAEQFRNNDGVFIGPTTMVYDEHRIPWWNMVKGSVNEATLGVQYYLTKALRIGPEVRYTWQGGHYGTKAFGAENVDGKRYSSQFNEQINLLMYF